MPDDAELLRSLRREIGAPSRPAMANDDDLTDRGGGRGREAGSSGGGRSRRSVGAGAGNMNDQAPAIGRVRDAEEGRSGGPEDDGYSGDREDGEDMAGQEYGFVMFDPVWGLPDYPPGHRTTACQLCGVMCCPCLTGRDGWRGARNQNVWKRIRKRAAVITCGVDLAVFVLSIAINGGFQPMWGRNDANPLLGPSVETMIALGAKHMVLIQEGQVWRLVTPILLHGGIFHIMMNLASQFRLGTFVEERWGTKKWLMIYWLGGLGGNLLSCVASPDKVGVGASGAIYAIMGGWISHIMCTWNERDDFDKRAQFAQALGFTIVGMLMSLTPIVDWAAHVGGLVVGIFLGRALFYKPVDSSRMLREPLRRKVARLQGKICLWLVITWMVLLTYCTFFVVTSSIPVPGRVPIRSIRSPRLRHGHGTP